MEGTAVSLEKNVCKKKKEDMRCAVCYVPSKTVFGLHRAFPVELSYRGIAIQHGKETCNVQVIRMVSGMVSHDGCENKIVQKLWKSCGDD